MTDHPAKPKGYKPSRDPAQIEADARADERAKIAEEIAALAAFICSDDAAFITGTDYPIDGGFLTLNT